MSNEAYICIRTNDEGKAEVYVVTDEGEYILPGIMSVDLHKIECGSVLLATLEAKISRLG